MFKHELFMNRRLLLLSFTIVVIAIIFFVQEITNKDRGIKTLAGQKEEREQIISLLSGNMKMHYTYADQQLEDIILRDKSHNEIQLSKLLEGKETLVFKFSSSNCSTCIQSGFSALRKIARNIPRERLIILADKSNRREVQALSNSMGLDYPIYLADDNAFSHMLRDENVPFVFVIGEDLRMKDLFIPMKELPDYSDMYYRIIWKKYFHK